MSEAKTRSKLRDMAVLLLQVIAYSRLELVARQWVFLVVALPLVEEGEVELLLDGARTMGELDMRLLVLVLETDFEERAEMMGEIFPIFWGMRLEFCFFNLTIDEVADMRGDGPKLGEAECEVELIAEAQVVEVWETEIDEGRGCGSGEGKGKALFQRECESGGERVGCGIGRVPEGDGI